MDQKTVDQKTVDQNMRQDQQTTPEHQMAPKQQGISEEEPPKDWFQQALPDQITPEGNEACLHQHQRFLRAAYSSDSDPTTFPGSRHSSLNTEPLTLDAEQMHDAKDLAEDIMQKVDPDTASEIFTQELQTQGDESVSPESEAQAVADQINALIEKAQQVVDANEQQSGSKVSGVKSRSQDEKKSVEDPATSLEEDVKLKAE